ncbi:MAG: hypothetical protein WA982_02400 [Rubrobacteraceae bacterium]
MYGNQRLAESGLEMRNKNVELARLNTKVTSIKVSLKGLLMWGGLILLLSGPLSVFTSLWWLILIFGAVLPLAIGLGSRISGFPQAYAALNASNHGEKALLEALERRGELAPAQAAIETSLTASEADRILCELAAKGYLEVRVADGRINYTL